MAIPGILWKAKRCIQYSMSCQDTRPVTTKAAVLPAPVARLVSKQWTRNGIQSIGTTHLQIFHFATLISDELLARMDVLIQKRVS